MIAETKVLVVDVDGTLCPERRPEEDYAALPCETALVEKLRAMHADGWRIVLHSARGMRTHGGNPGALSRHVLPTLTDWLARHGVPYDEILLGKPWPGRDGFYVDDRALRPREFVENDLDGMRALIARDRLAGAAP